jgi:ribosomal protein S18 acetylase RimI-like enzyme
MLRRAVTAVANLSPSSLRAIERLHVRAWPALATADVDGWLWRRSGGGSNRANSVSTVRFTGNDAEGALDAIEARYRSCNAPARVCVYDLSEPADLTERLKTRGYTNNETTLTMAKPLVRRAGRDDVTISERPGADWLAVYLGAITENRRVINAEILKSIPQPCAFFACRRDGRVISTGLGVADGDYAAIECMATCADARRQGGAQAVLAGIEHWACGQRVHTLALEAVAANTPAIDLYRGFGFEAVATNRFWVKDWT